MNITRMIQLDNDDFTTTFTWQQDHSVSLVRQYGISLKQRGGEGADTDVVLLTREEWYALIDAYTAVLGDPVLRTGIASAQVDGWIDYTPCAAQHSSLTDSPCVLNADHTPEHCNRYGTRW